MGLRFSRSAARHGISQDRARYVVDNCPAPRYADLRGLERDLVIFLWHDRNGSPLEVIAIELDAGDLVVIHAMKMRAAYQADYLEMLGWRER